jgi:hypothetical protein
LRKLANIVEEMETVPNDDRMPMSRESFGQTRKSAVSRRWNYDFITFEFMMFR